MEKREGYLHRLALHLEREARISGVNVEPEITKILEKLKDGHNGISTGRQREGQLW